MMKIMQKTTPRALGRPPRPPMTPDAQLIADVCAGTGETITTLARRMGIDPSVLSRANVSGPPRRRNRDKPKKPRPPRHLPDARREELRAMHTAACLGRPAFTAAEIGQLRRRAEETGWTVAGLISLPSGVLPCGALARVGLADNGRLTREGAAAVLAMLNEAKAREDAGAAASSLIQWGP